MTLIPLSPSGSNPPRAQFKVTAEVYNTSPLIYPRGDYINGQMPWLGYRYTGRRVHLSEQQELLCLHDGACPEPIEIDSA